MLPALWLVSTNYKSQEQRHGQSDCSTLPDGHVVGFSSGGMQYAGSVTGMPFPRKGLRSSRKQVFWESTSMIETVYQILSPRHKNLG